MVRGLATNERLPAGCGSEADVESKKAEGQVTSLIDFIHDPKGFV